jgi:hypothetical protein
MLAGGIAEGIAVYKVTTKLRQPSANAMEKTQDLSKEYEDFLGLDDTQSFGQHLSKNDQKPKDDEKISSMGISSK